MNFSSVVSFELESDQLIYFASIFWCLTISLYLSFALEKIIDDRKKYKKKGIKDLYYSASSAVYPGVKNESADLDGASSGRQYQYHDHEDNHKSDGEHAHEEDGEEAELKGWKESGYKIVAEVEYIDKGTFPNLLLHP